MENAITLGNTNYKLSSSAFTIIDYKSLFGIDIYEDIEKMVAEKEDITNSITVITRILYVLARPFLDNDYTYCEFSRDIPIDVLFDEEKMKEISNIILTLIPNKRGSKKVPIKKR